MGSYNNEARNTRTGHKEGGSKGEQGGYGTGKFKCAADAASKPAAKFQEASAVIGAAITGELSVPGVSIVKGASAPSFTGAPKGSPGLSQGTKVQKPKNALDSGY